MPKSVTDSMSTQEQAQELRTLFLYKLTHLGIDHFFTSGDEPVRDGLFSSDTYHPASVKHDRGGAPDKDSLTITVGLGDTWLRSYFLKYALQPIEVTIRRVVTDSTTYVQEMPLGVHINSRILLVDGADIYTEFVGRVTNCLVNGGVAVLTVTALGISENLQVPAVFFSQQCQWRLFGSACGLNKASWTQSSYVSAVDRDTRSVTVPAGTVSGYWDGGEFVVHGRAYPVLKSVYGISPGLSTLYLSIWPIDVAPGDACTITPGCSKTRSRCDFFGNQPNFGGFPFVPLTNPSIDGV